MRKFVCNICSYVYDEAKEGQKWEDLPEDWVCPLCKASKENFREEGNAAEEKAVVKQVEMTEDMKALNVLEMSILMSNFAKGCEKQYMTEESEYFLKLAEYFKSATPKKEEVSIEELVALVYKDLEEAYPYVNQVASGHADRGAMRALVWGEKVSKILGVLLARYEKEGKKMLENMGVYVCTICGYIHVDEVLPEICPICKVPNYKFEKIEGRA